MGRVRGVVEDEKEEEDLDLITTPSLLGSVHGPLALLAHEIGAFLGGTFRSGL